MDDVKLSGGRFDLSKVLAGLPVKTRNGSKMRFVAHVPAATPAHRLVMLDPETGEILTYWDDGCFFHSRDPSSLDLVTP